MAIYKLGELFNISGGSTPPTNDKSYWNGTLKWYTPIDIKNNTHTDRMISKSFHIPIPKETVIMSSRAPIGYVGIAQDEAWHSQGVKGFVNKNDNQIANKYFYYWLLLNAKTFEKFSVGSTFSEISKSQLEKLLIKIPSIEEQQKIIDIIEPVENLLKQINNLRNKLLIFVLNLPFDDKKEKISHFLEPIKNKPKHIKQISAKVLSNQGTISHLENIDTYKTNNFFTPKGSFVFCSIRTYLKKWGLIPCDVDSNGTLFQFSIKNNITSLISFLMSNDSWEKFNLLSSGTKMPVIKKESFLNVEFWLKTIEINKVDQILISFNQLELKTNLLKEKLIQLLIK